MISPTVKQVWNIAMHVLCNFFGLLKTQQLTTLADTAFISFYLKSQWVMTQFIKVFRSFLWGREQCDQIALLLFTLPVYIIENLPRRIKFAKVGTKVC